MTPVKDHGVLLRPELPTRAISLHAPWAWALMFAGKDVENRSCRQPGKPGGYTFPSNVLGRVWVHASLWPKPGPLRDFSDHKFLFIEHSEHMVETWWESLGLLDETYDIRDQDGIAARKEETLRRTGVEVPKISAIDAIRGHIVGSVEVTGYRTPDDHPDSPWYVPGSLAIMVRDPRPLAKPVPAKGALGWWIPSPDVMAQLEAQA